MAKCFRYLDELIHGDETGIFLDSDIVLEDAEEFQYEEGINIDVDDLTIDGNGFCIDAGAKSRIFHITGDNVTLKNITFKNAFFSESGAAVHADEVSLEILGCKFLANKSLEDGSAIFNEDGNVTVRKSTFVENESSQFGGAVCNWGELEISESLFRSNRAEYGGAIVNDSSELSVSDCEFANNSALKGGAILNNDTGEIKISKTLFSHNDGEKGGAIFSDNSDVSIEESLFDSNRSEDGGAIHTAGELRVKGSEFRENKANHDGGAIFAERADIDADDCLFDDNHVFGNGGAVHIYDGEMSVNQCEFRKNSAGFGAALACVKSVLDISGSSFGENSAESSGGAIWLDESDLDSDNNGFSHNRPDDVFGK